MDINFARLLVLPLAVAAGACGGAAAGTDPHDMSAAQHQAAAGDEESEGVAHAAQHDPNAEPEERCTGTKGRVCWTSNPTEGHSKTAAEHRELAAKHRGAAQTLVDAEARACVGISDEDRDTSPFEHVADIQSVTQLRDEKAVGRSKTVRDAGATIVFRATPGLSAEWLQRIVDCHVARNSAVGHDMPEMASCPLVPRGVKATVRSVGDGFAVDVRAEDDANSAEIWRRAQQIKPTR